MQTLTWELLELCRRSREGSYSYQRRRSNTLMMVGRVLTTPVTTCVHCGTRAPRGAPVGGCPCWQAGLGYQQMRLGDFERRHSRKLLRLWQAAGLSPDTIINYYVHLRWWARKIGKPDVIPVTNDFITGVRRSEVATVSQGQTLTAEDLARVDDPSIRLSLELQMHFGLRCEESLLIRPHRADQGAQLWLKGSWTKGGRGRVIAITTAEQRDVLARAKAFVGHKDAALIPADKTLAQQRRHYYYCLEKAGLAKMHGLRHGFAAQRYQELSGMASPVQGGPSRRAMSAAEQAQDQAARQQVSAALGHNRVRITKTYMG